MGRSISVRPAPPDASFYHRRSNRNYTISGNTMRRHQTGADGREVNILGKTIDLAIGSGNHAVTYVTRTAQGRLLELPLSWYRKTDGWGMSPGYDRSDHEDFRREISGTCLFCHSAGPEPGPIDCSRCHGSAEAHLKSPGKGSILNPAKLDASRQLDVCLQCHLQTASAGIPDSVRQPGKSVWSFQPGMRLGEYKMLFDFAEQPSEDRLEINHAGYRLMQSACFRKSEGKLLCTTCHDPHTAKVRENACLQCHESVHPGRSREGCEGCHMPKRVPSDAVLTTITDHKIVRVPRFIDPKEEDHRLYRGHVTPFYTAADELSIAAVNVPGPDDVVLYRKLIARDGRNPTLRVTLGKILLRSGRAAEAIPALDEALRLDPMYTEARNYRGVAAAMLGKYAESLVYLRKAVADNPDHALSWTNLGITLEAAGDPEGAKAAYTEAIRLQPDSAEARQRRARLESAARR